MPLKLVSVYLFVFLPTRGCVMHLLFPHWGPRARGTDAHIAVGLLTVLQHLLVTSDRSVLALCRRAAWQHKSS